MSKSQFNIRRSEHNFTIISNTVFRDKTLSLRAKGLLCTMLSLPDDWNYSIKGLCTITREGYDSISSTIRELENAGYIVRTQQRTSTGRIAGTVYDVYETPLSASAPCSDDEDSTKVEDTPPASKTARIQTQTDSNEVLAGRDDTASTCLQEHTRDAFAELCAKSLRHVTVTSEDAAREAYNAAINRGYTPEQISAAYDKYVARYRDTNETLQFAKRLERWLADADGLSWDAPRPANPKRKVKTSDTSESTGTTSAEMKLTNHLCEVSSEYAALPAERTRIGATLLKTIISGGDTQTRATLENRERELISRLAGIKALYNARGDAAFM